MIQNISIENFRCFDKTEIKGFGRINLITGKNNSGKTCLLEALYFMFSENVNETGQIRNRAFEYTFESVTELLHDIERKDIKMSCKLSNSVIEGYVDYLSLSYNVISNIYM